MILLISGNNLQIYFLYQQPLIILLCFFSNKKFTVSIQTHTTQIENSIYFIEKQGYKDFKDYWRTKRNKIKVKEIKKENKE